MKKLSDFPSYTDAKAKFTEREIAGEEWMTEREAVAKKLHEARAAGETLIRDGENFINVKSVFDRLVELDQNISLNKQAVEAARAEVERIRGQASVEICREARPAFVAQIEIILKSLKQICDANARLEKLRDEMNVEGVETGSIPHCLFQGIGSFDDREKMGTAFVYKTWIEQNFPEVKI